jgi:hypothetical protein
MRKQATNALVWRLYQPLLSALRRHPADGPQAPFHARLVAAYGKLTHSKEYDFLFEYVCVMSACLLEWWVDTDPP